MKPPLAVNRRRFVWMIASVILIYVLVSYLVLPATWTRVEHEPGLSKRAMVTTTAQGIPGGPINVGLIGTKEDVVSAFHAAGWYPADPITLRTSVEIIGSVLLDRSFNDAPVSPLYFDGRREDLAFEKPDGIAPTAGSMSASGWSCSTAPMAVPSGLDQRVSTAGSP